MEIWYQDNVGNSKVDRVYDYYSRYDSPPVYQGAEKRYSRTAFRKDIDDTQPYVPGTYIRGSIYNLCGQYWIATAYKTLDY